MCRFPLFIISMAHFSMQNSIPMFWMYIFTACIRVSNPFSFLADSLMTSMYIRWLIFSCYLLSLYLSVHFLSMWLSGLITITNSNSDSASLWNIPVWILTSAKLFPPLVSSTHQVSVVFSINFEFVRYLVHFETIPGAPYKHFYINQRHSQIFSSRITLVDNVLINVKVFSSPSGSLAALFLFLEEQPAAY